MGSTGDEPEAHPSGLTVVERLVAGLLAAGAFVATGCLTYAPPLLTKVQEGCAAGVSPCTASVHEEQKALALGAGGVGAALLLFALNGGRITSAKNGDNEITVSRSQREAVRKVRKASAVVADASKPTPEDGAPTPEARRPAQVIIGDVQLDVSPPGDLPIQVVADLVAGSDDAAGFSAVSVRDIEYGARRPGRGNHPWIVGLSGGKIYSVSYGGRGKAGATVREVG